MSTPVFTVSGYSPFWANVMSPNQPQGGTFSMDQSKIRSKAAWRVARIFNQGGMRDARGLLAALIGAASGGTATNQYVRRRSPGATNMAVNNTTGFGAFGGNIGTETVDAINRATTAADVTEMKKWFAQALLESGITYPSVLGNSLSSGMQVAGAGRF